MESKVLLPVGGAGRVLRQLTHRKDKSLSCFWRACTKCPGPSLMPSLIAPSMGLVGTCVADTGTEGVAPDRGMLHLGESVRQGGEASPDAASRVWWRSFISRVQRSCQRSCQSSRTVQSLERAQSVDARELHVPSCQAFQPSPLSRLEWYV